MAEPAKASRILRVLISFDQRSDSSWRWPDSYLEALQAPEAGFVRPFGLNTSYARRPLARLRGLTSVRAHVFQKWTVQGHPILFPSVALHVELSKRASAANEVLKIDPTNRETLYPPSRSSVRPGARSLADSIHS